MTEYDYEEMRRRYTTEERLRNDGKACTMCVCYRLYENPGKGTARGYCSLKCQENPNRPAWWGVAMNHVCYRFEEEGHEE